MKISVNIIKRLKKKDEEAFNIIYNKYYRLIYTIILGIVKNKETSEELMIDTFHIAYNKIDMLKKEEESSFKYWIIKIAKNLALDYLKTRKDNLLIYDNDVVNATVKNSYGIELINLYYSNLNQEEIEIINYYIIGNLKFREIAQLMDSTVSIISKKYYNAINKLKKYL